MAIERKLLGGLLYTISNAEWKGLTLLSGAVAASNACVIDENGIITAKCGVKVRPSFSVSDIKEMCRKRIFEVHQVHHSEIPDSEVDICLDVRKTICLDDGHLYCWASSTASGVKKEACVVTNDAYARTPATDNCFAFVLWADSGFRRMPMTLRDAIFYCRDPEEAERKIAEEMSRMELMRKTFHEQKLRRDAEIREAELLRTLKNDERIRLSHMGWRELMIEQGTDEGGNSFSELFARDFRSTMLRGGVVQ